MVHKVVVSVILLRALCLIHGTSAYNITDWAYESEHNDDTPVMQPVKSDVKAAEPHKEALPDDFMKTEVSENYNLRGVGKTADPHEEEAAKGTHSVADPVKDDADKMPKPMDIHINDYATYYNLSPEGGEHTGNEEIGFPFKDELWARTTDPFYTGFADDSSDKKDEKKENELITEGPVQYETPVPVDSSSSQSSKEDVAVIIPPTPSEDQSVNSGNEDTIIDDTASVTHKLREDTLKKIDETLHKLDTRLREFLSAVSISTHDLKYYEKLLEMAYKIFCKEINGHLGDSNPATPNSTGVNVTISAEMSNAIRRSFDTKIEVLELAASELAAKKSKEIGARTIHDALVKGLLNVKTIISSPGLTIKKTTHEMKTMTSIIEDIRKTLADDVINTTLVHNAAKKELFDKIQERDTFMNQKGIDATRIETYTHQIHDLASKFHRLQNDKANAVMKQNGFKQYMDSMRQDMNAIQRLIDTFFATVHNGHAKAIIQEASNELRKDSAAESAFRLHLAEEKVHEENLEESQLTTSHLICPPRYRPLHPDAPISNTNPCVREDKLM